VTNADSWAAPLLAALLKVCGVAYYGSDPTGQVWFEEAVRTRTTG
jgi:hypothetical protein